MSGRPARAAASFSIMQASPNRTSPVLFGAVCAVWIIGSAQNPGAQNMTGMVNRPRSLPCLIPNASARACAAMMAAVNGGGLISRVQPGSRLDAGHGLAVKGNGHAGIALGYTRKDFIVMFRRKACEQAPHPSPSPQRGEGGDYAGTGVRFAKLNNLIKFIADSARHG
jgi:hypothetical protein